MFEEEREVKSMDILFEFSSEFEIVECGVHIWKDQSGRDNSGGYQTAYGEEEVDNNKQDTYEFSKTSYKQEDGKYVNLNPVQRAKR